jgi:hypothetical protein
MYRSFVNLQGIRSLLHGREERDAWNFILLRHKEPALNAIGPVRLLC